MGKRTPWLILLAILVVGGVLFAAQHALLQSANDRTSGDAPGATATPSGPTAYAVEQTVTSTTGGTFTVQAVTAVTDGDRLITPPAGGSFLGVEVKVCAGTAEYLADPSLWDVILSNGDEEPDALMVQPSQGPEFPTEEVQPGACAVGWVYFALPASPAPARVSLAGADWFWTIS